MPQLWTLHFLFFSLFFFSCWRRSVRGIEGRKRRAKRCPPWWLLFLRVFVGLALAQWSTAFKWATRECLNGEAGGVVVCACVRVCFGGGWCEATRVCCDAGALSLDLVGSVGATFYCFQPALWCITLESPFFTSPFTSIWLQ